MSDEIIQLRISALDRGYLIQIATRKMIAFYIRQRAVNSPAEVREAAREEFEKLLDEALTRLTTSPEPDSNYRE